MARRSSRSAPSCSAWPTRWRAGARGSGRCTASSRSASRSPSASSSCSPPPPRSSCSSSAHDALLLMVIVVFAGVVAVRAAQLFATDAMRDIEVLRDTLVAVGEGSRAPAAVNGSADEVAELAARGEHRDPQARPRGARSPRPDRGRLARPAHADHLAATAERGGRRRHRRRAHAPGLPRADADAHRDPVRPDRRPVRAVAARGRGHPVDDPAGVARPARRGGGRRAAAAGRGQGRQRPRRRARRASRRAPTRRRCSGSSST